MAEPAARSDISGQSQRRGRKLEAEWRRMRAVELARAGLTWEDVAKGAGYRSRSAARDAVHTYLRQRQDDAARVGDEWRTLELDRLDTLQASLWDKAVEDHDMDAVNRVLAIHDRRVRLDPRLAPANPVTSREAAEIAARTDRDLAATVIDVMLSLAERLEFTPEQRVKAPSALLAELESRHLVVPGSVVPDARPAPADPLAIEGTVIG